MMNHRRSNAGPSSDAAAYSQLLGSEPTPESGSSHSSSSSTSHSSPSRSASRKRRRKRHHAHHPSSMAQAVSTAVWYGGQLLCILLTGLFLFRLHQFLTLGQVTVILSPASTVSYQVPYHPVSYSADNVASTVNVGPLSSEPDLAQNPSLRHSATTLSQMSLPKNRGKHKHVIPNHISFTHYMNFLDDGVLDDLPEPRSNDERWEHMQLRALRDNVQQIVDLHPGTTTHFYTDDDCIEAMRTLVLETTDNTDDEHSFEDPQEVAEQLVHYFEAETQGMYKADLCRGVALYHTGGLYLDVDLGVRMNLWDALELDTEFATAKVHMASAYLGNFFQAFMAVTPRHPIVRRYILLFLDYYQGRLTDLPSGPIGVLLLKRAYDEVIHDEPAVEETVELWQEVFYHPDYQDDMLQHVPPPTWGGPKRACHFVVVSNRDADPITVPLYSRIANSRMCPAMPEGEMGIYKAASRPYIPLLLALPCFF